MSITTKRGDGGETDLLYGKRVPKTHPRMVALGAVDELTASLGLVRIHAQKERTKSILPRVQMELIGLMGLMAVARADYPRDEKDGCSNLTSVHLDTLTEEAKNIESHLPPVTDWILPGSKGCAASAYLDHARTICRNAERAVLALDGENASPNPHLPAYLNRLSDLLWLLARLEED